MINEREISNKISPIKLKNRNEFKATLLAKSMPLYSPITAVKNVISMVSFIAKIPSLSSPSNIKVPRSGTKSMLKIVKANMPINMPPAI